MDRLGTPYDSHSLLLSRDFRAVTSISPYRSLIGPLSVPYQSPYAFTALRQCAPCHCASIAPRWWRTRDNCHTPYRGTRLATDRGVARRVAQRVHSPGALKSFQPMPASTSGVAPYLDGSSGSYGGDAPNGHTMRRLAPRRDGDQTGLLIAARRWTWHHSPLAR